MGGRWRGERRRGSPCLCMCVCVRETKMEKRLTRACARRLANLAAAVRRTSARGRGVRSRVGSSPGANPMTRCEAGLVDAGRLMLSLGLSLREKGERGRERGGTVELSRVLRTHLSKELAALGFAFFPTSPGQSSV